MKKKQFTPEDIGKWLEVDGRRFEIIDISEHGDVAMLDGCTPVPIKKLNNPRFSLVG